MIRALLGGSFDPFHNGHLAMVHSVLASGLADWLAVIPAYHSPHKSPPVASAEHRLHMAELALFTQAHTEVLNLEVERGGISYTVDTVEDLMVRWPDDQLRLVMGADNLTSFHSWNRPRDLLAHVELIVLARHGWDGEVPEELSSHILLLRDFDQRVSSTGVRRALAAGSWPTGWVPEPVLDYIATHGLYRTTTPPADTPEVGGV